MSPIVSRIRPDGTLYRQLLSEKQKATQNVKLRYIDTVYRVALKK